MNKTLFDNGWQMRVFDEIMQTMGEKMPIQLPHDHSIAQKMDKNSFSAGRGAYLPGGIIEYEKTFTLSAQKAMVLFEGVYMGATVCLNGHIIGKQPYGYSSFISDMTPHLQKGENKLTVRVNNSALPNSRWYSGTGIYRHVYLLTAGDQYIAPWGVFVKTPKATAEEAVFEIETAVSGGDTLRQTLLDMKGNKVGETEGKTAALQRITLEKPRLWSPDSPYLYTLVTELCVSNKVVDTVTTKTGARAISVDTKKGFQLNGETIKLKGGCAHHDCGLLGAAAYDRAEERKVQLLKKSGYNAVRCAHNPPSPSFLDACDRLGLMVIDEAFDSWRVAKTENDYSVFFDDWWERDLSAMVLRDRNHPSIIMWSIGNEVPDSNGRSGGAQTARMLAEAVRALDATRPVTAAFCAFWWDEAPEPWAQATEKVMAPLDVAGYNYLLGRYEEDGERYPNRVICGTETYPKDIFDYWEKTVKLPYVIGDFVWTSLDYLGEAGIGRILNEGETDFAGPYPWSHAYCGDIDLCGRKRPQSYYRDCVWGQSRAPYIAVHRPCDTGKKVRMMEWGYADVVPSWNWPGEEGKSVQVDVYSEEAEVTLFLNGQSLGKKPAGKANRYIATFEVPYVPGRLVAKDKRRETMLKTPGAPAKLRISADCAALQGKNDLAYVDIALVDMDGVVVDKAELPIYVTATGAGSVVAIGSGNPKTDEPYTGNTRRLYRGQAMAVIRAERLGEAIVTVCAEGFPSEQILISVE